jgi:toxin HigB-1
MAIKTFGNRATEEINYGLSSKASRRLLPPELHLKAQTKLARIGAATSLRDLQELKGNKLEALKGDRKGQYSIRINDRYRICFHWQCQDAFEVEIVDYHD